VANLLQNPGSFSVDAFASLPLRVLVIVPVADFKMGSPRAYGVAAG
jgi:hypothetical protein